MHQFLKPTVILLAHRRSGTTVFKDMLRNSGKTHFDGDHEVFHTSVHSVKNFYHFWNLKVLENPENPHSPGRNDVMIEFLDYKLSIYPAEIVRFDIKYYQFRQCGALFDMLVNSNCIFIHLIRSNIVKGYISDYLLGLEKKTKQISTGRTFIKNIDQFEKGIADRINEIEHFKRRLVHAKLPPSRLINLEYEDLFADLDDRGSGRHLSPAVLEQLEPLLGANLDASQFWTSRTKTNAPSCREIIENFDELRSAITKQEILDQLEA